MTLDLTSGTQPMLAVRRISYPSVWMPCSFLPHLSEGVLFSQLPEAVWSVRFHYGPARCGQTVLSRQTSSYGQTGYSPCSPTLMFITMVSWTNFGLGASLPGVITNDYVVMDAFDGLLLGGGIAPADSGMSRGGHVGQC